jgi:hypothetical protein
MKLNYVFEATLSPGGCLYVPAYYWWQSETQKTDFSSQQSPESMFISFDYESSSIMVDKLFGALDKGLLEE